MLAARRLDRLKDLAAKLQGTGVRCGFMETDVQNYEQVHRLVEETVQQYGRIDVLINNAGMGLLGLFHSQSWEGVSRVLRTNLEGALAMCHAVIPQLIRQRSGVIVNVSSVVGKRSTPRLAAYCASKFGLWGFSEALGLELQPLGIHVCHFCPTNTATEFQEKAGITQIHRRRLGLDSPDRVARAMVDAVVSRRREHIMSVTERVLIKSHLIAPALTDRLLRLVRRDQEPIAHTGRQERGE